MNTSMNCRILITRQQYDEAASKLPTVAGYPKEEIDIEVNAGPLWEALTGQPVPDDPKPRPMRVTFTKHFFNTERFGWTRQSLLAWKLSPFYKIL